MKEVRILTAIRLMIAGDPSIFRDGLKLLLELENEFQVIGVSDNGSECIQMLSELEPDLLILDLHMSDKSGYEILTELNKNENRTTKVLIITDSNPYYKNYLLKSCEIGIDGYLLKRAKTVELKKAIISIVVNNEVYIQSDLHHILEDMEHNSTDLDRINQLTKRELDVLKHLAVGMYNKEISLKLNISERTVKNHISSIFKKIGVSDRTQAAVFTIRNNLIEI